MQTKLTSRDLMDREVLGRDNSKIGNVRQVYLNEQSGIPEWVTVHTGWFGHRESFIPLNAATETNGSLRVPYDKETIKEAPRIDTNERLSPNEIAELYRHYGLSAAGGPMTGKSGPMSGRESARPPGAKGGKGAQTGGQYADISEQGRMQGRTSGKATGKLGSEGVAGGRRSEAEMTRSEERLRVGTEQQEVGHIRLRKWVETEHVSKAVPLTHEEVRIEREPIMGGEAGNAMIGEDEREVILHEERPVIGKETVPVERVRLTTEQVTEEQMIEGDIRKENVEVVEEGRTRRSSRGNQSKAGDKDRRNNR